MKFSEIMVLPVQYLSFLRHLFKIWFLFQRNDSPYFLQSFHHLAKILWSLTYLYTALHSVYIYRQCSRQKIEQHELFILSSPNFPNFFIVWDLYFCQNYSLTMIDIDNPLIERISCLRKKQWYQYKNVLPAIPMYVLAASCFWKMETVGACVVLGTVIFFHVFSFFLCLWSLRFRAWIQYQKVRSLYKI